MVAPAHPDVFILNFGIWGDQKTKVVGDEPGARQLVAAFRSSAARPIWRTTSPAASGHLEWRRQDEILPLVVAAGVEVYDVGAMMAPLADRPSYAPYSAYWDSALGNRAIGQRETLSTPPPPPWPADAGYLVSRSGPLPCVCVPRDEPPAAATPDAASVNELRAPAASNASADCWLICQQLHGACWA